MKIHNFEQLSDEWFECRKGKITASHADTIATNGKGLETYINEIMAEYFSSGEKEHFSNEHTERGNDLEDTARSIYELENNVKVEQVGFIEYNDFVGCSPDGLIGEDEGLEIKCCSDKVYWEILMTGDCSSMSKWKWQCLMNLLITQRKKWNLVIFNPNFKKSMIKIEILPDEEKFNKLLTGFTTAEQKIISLKDKYNNL